MTELDKLEEYLKEKGIEYERIDNHPDFQNGNWHQICVPCYEQEFRQWDAVCHAGSYGYEQGLLEIMGIICPDHDVLGFLTAEAVIRRIEFTQKVVEVMTEAIKKDGLKLMEEKMLRGDANDKITE